MSTVRMMVLAKKERARPKEAPARSKSGEETPKKGSHERRDAARASRSGIGREIGAFMKAQEAVEVGRHATSLCGREILSGQGLVDGQLSENQSIARSKERVLRSPPRCSRSNLAPWLNTSVDIRARLSPVATLYSFITAVS